VRRSLSLSKGGAPRPASGFRGLSGKRIRSCSMPCRTFAGLHPRVSAIPFGKLRASPGGLQGAHSLKASFRRQKQAKHPLPQRGALARTGTDRAFPSMRNPDRFLPLSESTKPRPILRDIFRMSLSNRSRFLRSLLLGGLFSL